jgi:hypothetical protein
MTNKPKLNCFIVETEVGLPYIELEHTMPRVETVPVCKIGSSAH